MSLIILIVICFFAFADRWRYDIKYSFPGSQEKLEDALLASGLEFTEVKPKPDTAMLFTGHLWLAAKRDDTLYTAIQNYYLSGNPDYPSTDFRFGPVADDYSSAAYAAKYNWTWKLNRSDIENHKQNYQQPGYNPIGEILNWPAHVCLLSALPFIPHSHFKCGRTRHLWFPILFQEKYGRSLKQDPKQQD